MLCINTLSQSIDRPVPLVPTSSQGSRFVVILRSLQSITSDSFITSSDPIQLHCVSLCYIHSDAGSTLVLFLPSLPYKPVASSAIINSFPSCPRRTMYKRLSTSRHDVNIVKHRPGGVLRLRIETVPSRHDRRCLAAIAAERVCVAGCPVRNAVRPEMHGHVGEEGKEEEKERRIEDRLTRKKEKEKNGGESVSK